MIRFTFRYLKPVAWILIIAVLFQCCKVYDKNPVTLDQAIDEARLKIVTNDGREYVFDEIYYKNDSLLCGITREKESQTIEIILSKEQIKEQVYDGTKHGGTDVFITIDGEKYNFDSYYYKNDTLHGILKGRLQTEILIPIETIKEIYLYNTRKSRTGTALIVIGGVVGAWLLTSFILWIIAMAQMGREGDGI